MPEVVYPKPAEDGSPRTWDQVFPIWKNDDEAYEWQLINQILEAIAMNNRFGGETVKQLQARLIKVNTEWFTEKLAKLEGEPHKHEEEFPEANHLDLRCSCPVPEDRKELLKERRQVFESYGRVMFYLQRIFEELGGAYREWKTRPEPVEVNN